MIEKKTLREVTNNYYLFDYLIGKLDFITNANTHYLNSLYYDFQDHTFRNIYNTIREEEGNGYVLPIVKIPKNIVKITKKYSKIF